ncbi:hypothetical protein EMPS_07238 [Entomortierella parvispora]|uniref:F-box domain-containing protein n=1 Tax=Entomortierella parvispora TaxID=205924 RepID=A0A9P3HDS5_9FUNG|nr:hypothetical protein EMPS_07238 [Entomortierella parvispora]
MLCSFLDNVSLKSLSVCCKEWHENLAPKVWTRLHLYDHDRSKMAILTRYGHLIFNVNLSLTDKTMLRAVRESCPRLEILSMILDDRSLWIDYPFLRSFFGAMSSLSSLRIRVDIFRFSPAMFWSLSSAVNLKSLHLDAFYAQYYTSKHYHPDAYMSILDCCPQLENLQVRGAVFEPADVSAYHNKNSFIQSLRKTFRPSRENTPKEPSLGNSGSHHSRSSSSNLPLTSHSRLKGTNTRSAKDDSYAKPNYRIKKLHLSPIRMDNEVFRNLVCRCSDLEDLYLDGVWIRFTVQSWHDMAEVCTKLRHLHVRYTGTIEYMPNVQTLVKLFPKLQTVALQSLALTEDPDLSNLGEQLAAIEQQSGQKHPLRRMEITGSVRHPLRMLLHAVTQVPTIEVLIMGTTMECERTAVPESDMATATLYKMKADWKCVDHLKLLDLTNILMPNAKTFGRLMNHIQRLPKLETLYLSISQSRHLLAWTEGEDGILVYGSHDPIKEPICLSSLRTLGIGKAYRRERGRGDLPARLDEVQSMIDMCPALRTLSLTHPSEAGVTRQLSAEFPGITFVSS